MDLDDFFDELNWETMKAEAMRIDAEIMSGINQDDIVKTIKELAIEIQQAIDSEDYELAAKLRDEIKARE